MAYLVATKARGGTDCYLYLGNKYGKLFNGPIFILDRVIKAVITSAAKEECGRLYTNIQDSPPIRNTLIKIGHIQPPYETPVRTDNSTAG